MGALSSSPRTFVSEAVSLVSLFVADSSLDFAGRGVPDLAGSSSSSIANPDSNSDGSGPFRRGSPSFLPRGAEGPPARLLGEPLRGAGLVVPVFALDGDAWYERWRACSSVILESIASFSR